MLNETPTWTFTSKRSLTRWFEHVHLLSNRVLGYWFCLDRSSGTPLWERNLKPDEIVGIQGGVIVANERQRLSFSSMTFGCYGISLESGKLLWTSHASGFRGWVGWALATEDCPIYIDDRKCYCRSGRILDVKTGKLIERVPQEEIVKPDKPESDTDILARSMNPADSIKLKFGDGHWLSHESASESVADIMCEFPVWLFEFRLSLTDDKGQVKWEFDLNDTDYEMRYCPYIEKCRYSAPYLYLLACEKRTSKKTENNHEFYNPTRFHLLTLSVDSGSIVQDIQITDSPVDQCRFEDIDESGLLISDAERTLYYFERC